MTNAEKAARLLTEYFGVEERRGSRLAARIEAELDAKDSDFLPEIERRAEATRLEMLADLDLGPQPSWRANIWLRKILGDK